MTPRAVAASIPPAGAGTVRPTAIFLALLLAGCSQSRAQIQQVLAQCQLDAANAAHTDDVTKVNQSYVLVCMAAKGYEEDLNARHCTPDNSPYANPGCYRALSNSY
jgi:hypothetical protein